MTIVKVSAFKGKNAKANKNGKMPLWLTYISGDVLPSDCLVIDGTVAEGSDISNGQTLVINVVKSGENEFKGFVRNNYNYTVVDSKVAAEYFHNVLSESKTNGVVKITSREVEVNTQTLAATAGGE